MDPNSFLDANRFLNPEFFPGLVTAAPNNVPAAAGGPTPSQPLPPTDEITSAVAKRKLNQEEGEVPQEKKVRGMQVSEAAPAAAPQQRIISVSKRKFEETAENGEQRLKELKELGLLVRHLLSGYLPEPSYFDPIWQFLNFFPEKKRDLLVTDLIVWGYLCLALSKETIQNKQALPETIAQLFDQMGHVEPYNSYGQLFYELTRSFDVEAVFSQIEKVVEEVPLYNHHISFIFEFAGHPRVNTVLEKMARIPSHFNDRKFTLFLFTAFREGKFSPELRTHLGVCNWIKQGRLTMTPEDFRDWLSRAHLPDEVCKLLLPQPSDTVTLPEAELYFDILGRVYDNKNPSHLLLRDRLREMLSPQQPQIVKRWLALKLPKDDPLYLVTINNCSAAEFVKILNTSEHYFSETAFERLIELGTEFCEQPEWEKVLRKLLEAILSIRDGVLKPNERVIFIEWLKRADPQVHRGIFLRLIQFIDFPTFWPYFRIHSSTNSKKLTKFLFDVAIYWPELSLKDIHHKAPLHTPMDTRHLIGQVLHYHHFPEIALFPTLPAQISTLYLKKLIIIYCSLSIPHYRTHFIERLPQLFGEVNQLVATHQDGDDSDSDHDEYATMEERIAILFLKLLKKIVLEEKTLPIELAPSFQAFVQALAQNKVLENGPLSARLLEETIDELKTLMPQFFEEIDLTPLKPKA